MLFHGSSRASVRAVVCFGVLIAICYGQTPAVSLSPTSLTFASQLVGTPSPAQTITLTNTGSASLSITKISITGTNIKDYSQTNNCGKSVAAGASCTVNVTFTPVAKGTRTANVSFSDNAAGSPQTVPLTGTGIAPFVKLTPTSLTFSGQQVGTTSASQNVTLKNTGTATLTITSIAASGDFAQTNTCGSTVAVNATCTIIVTFTPTAEGTRTGSVSVTDNATGSPQSVTLTGTGLAALVSLSPTSLTFASQTVGTTSSPQTVTLTNTGNESLSVTSIGASGDYAQTNTCGTSVAAGANCTVSVTFTPTTTGTRTGTVTFTDSASDSPQTVTLSGTGISAAVTPTLTVLGPGPRVRHSAVLDTATNSMIIFGGQNTGINNFNDVWQSIFFEDTTVNYVPVSPSGTAPAARYGHTGVYDATNSRMMIFAGATGVGTPAPCQNDMWVLQNANGAGGTPNWTQLTPSGGPPLARYGHASVYDPNTNSMIVFGGSDCASGLFNDVWVLSNANGTGGTPAWTQLSPGGFAPSGREASTAIYDPTTNVMVVFGGDQGSSTTLNDVWALSNANGTGGTATWTQLFPTGTAPSARTGHSAVYDSANNRMIMYGGVLANGSVVADTWILTGANGQSGTPAWSLLTVTNGTAKAYHSAVYNPATNEMTVFAGEIAVVPSDDHIFTLFNANGLAVGQSAWKHKGIHARYGHTAVFDPGSNRMIILAGQHAKNFPDEFDLWFATYTPGSTELQMTPPTLATGHPSARFGHTAVYDATNNRMVIFGGGTGTSTPGPCRNDLWLLQNANGVSATPAWTQQKPSGTAPTARFAANAVYDPNTNTMILFGGYDCTGTYFNDVWLLSNANGLGGTPTWTQLSASGAAPSGREAATAVYDSTNNLLIVFGGDVGTAVDGDVWVLSHANGTGGTPTWSQLLPTGPGPAARSGHSAIYDPANNRMTVYGGQTSNSVANLLNDFWVLTNANGLGGTAAWTQLTPQTPGAYRSFHTAVYDAAQNTMLIFGGKTSVALLPADDHVTVVTEANGLQP